MADEWASIRLGDVTDLLTGFPFKSDHYVGDATAPRLLRGDNVAQGALRWDGVKRWPQNALSDVDDYWLREGDVILAMDRPWIEAGLKYASVRGSDLPALLVQRVARLRGTDRLDTRFLKYVIGSRPFTDYVLAIQTGTAVPHISGGQIRSYEFLLPSLPEQRAIAHILGTLDDKIELNRRMNETLEAMARALFNSWFVDFDPVRANAEGRDTGLPKLLTDLFPDSFEDSELGEIPKGWCTSSVYDLATYINGAAFRAFEPNEEHRGLPIIKIAELKAGVTAQTRFSGVDMPNKYRIDTGDILFSWSGNPDTSIDIFIWTHGPAWLNQHIFRVVPRNSRERAFVLMTLRTLRPVFAEIARNKQTTGLGHVTVEDLKRLLVVSPPEPVLEGWNTITEPMLARSFGLAKESNTLAALRDTLLPKLISGELRTRTLTEHGTGRAR